MKILDIENRKKIYALIKKHPGLNLSSIAEMLKMRVSLVDYHLTYLERYDLITSIKDDWFKHYYVKEDVSPLDRKIIVLLRKKSYLKIVLLIMKYPNSTHGEILEHLDISRSTLSYYLDKLLKKGIIVKSNKVGEHKKYIVFDEKKISQIISKYNLNK